MIGSDTIGYEVRTLDNLLFRMLLAYSAKAGMDELTMMHGWIIAYLYDKRKSIRRIWRRSFPSPGLP